VIEPTVSKSVPYAQDMRSFALPHRSVILTLALLTLGVTHSKVGEASSTGDPLPGLSVPDLIGLTRFGSTFAGGEGGDDGVYSPDGAYVAVVSQRGILKDNLREFTLWLVPTSRASDPKVLTSVRTGSERPGIHRVSWLSSTKLAFLAESTGGTAQVYTLDIENPVPIQRTDATLPIATFAASADGTTTAFVTDDPPPSSAGFDHLRAHGLVIPPEMSLSDAMLGKWGQASARTPVTNVIHVIRQGVESTVPMPDVETFGHLIAYAAHSFILSPDGGEALVITMPVRTPPQWDAYTNDNYVQLAKLGGRTGGWVLINLRTGAARLLTGGPSMAFDAPNGSAFWTDAKHVVLVNELLSLDGISGEELAKRASTPMTAELDVESGAVSIIEPRDHFLSSGWDAKDSTLTLQPMKRNGRPEDPGNGHDGPPVAFRREPTGWVSVRVAATTPKIEVSEGLNQPWQLRRSRAGRLRSVSSLLLDPNRALLRDRRLARETEVHWMAPSGARLSAGLYWPLSYERGKRYPIVLQTHGFEPRKFQPDGYSTTGYAAQPLAAAGMFVAQVHRCEDCDTVKRLALKEGERVVESWDGILDYLDREGLIDPKLVGIQGYSRSCYQQLFYLTHSSHAVAAMVCTQGVDHSYMQYLVFAPRNSYVVKDFDLQNGGQPWGDGLKSWLERAPGFLLDRIHTPLRLISMTDPSSLLEEWEPFAGLSLLGKPVELFYLPNAGHNIVRPWERLASQQGTVDWFRFWLQGYERVEPVGEAEESLADLEDQYMRWHKLRDKQS
jgi:dipeptidyl aminopeptidase/acylaminoacyl peptidase